MAFLIDNARASLEEMKRISKRLSEIDKELKVNNNNFEQLYGEQFKLIMDISKEFEQMSDILDHLEKQDEGLIFLVRRLRQQAEVLIGERTKL